MEAIPGWLYINHRPVDGLLRLKHVHIAYRKIINVQLYLTLTY